MNKTQNKKKTESEKSEKSENKTITLDQASDQQLKAAAFDLDQQIKVLQQQYQNILGELQRRTSSKDEE
jgi:hypothetical protein